MVKVVAAAMMVLFSPAFFPVPIQEAADTSAPLTRDEQAKLNCLTAKTWLRDTVELQVHGTVAAAKASAIEAYFRERQLVPDIIRDPTDAPEEVYFVGTIADKSSPDNEGRLVIYSLAGSHLLVCP